MSHPTEGYTTFRTRQHEFDLQRYKNEKSKWRIRGLNPCQNIVRIATGTMAVIAITKALLIARS